MLVRKRLLCLFVLQVMLVAQILIAGHAAVHFTENSHIATTAQHENGNTNDHDHQPQSDKICQIGLSAKSTSQALLTTPVLVPEPLELFKPDFPPVLLSTVQNSLRAYQARAPPALLI